MFWEQSDAVTEVIDRLGRAVPDPDMVRGNVPSRWTVRDGIIITVEDDGTPMSTRGWTKQNVRITVRAQDLFTAGRVMRSIDSFLTTPGLQNLGLPIRPAGGIIGGPDSRLSCFFNSCTYGVQLPRKVV